MMKIAVNTRLLISNKLEGIGYFAHEILSRMVKAHPEVEFYFLFDRQPSDEFIYASNVTPVVLKPQARHPVLFVYWFERSVKRWLDKHPVDVFFSPDGYLSLGSNTPQVPVIHDLNFEHRPGDLPKLVRSYYKRYFPKFAKKAAKIITVSEFSKQDIVNTYGVDESSVHVVYNGVGEGFYPAKEGERHEECTMLNTLSGYFVYVGSLHKRKNIQNMFSAFDKFKKQGSPFKLVVVGAKMWNDKQMERQFNQLAHHKDIIFTGRLDREAVQRVVRSSNGLILVSHFEGFGVPIIEAFASDVPVLCSNVTALPEVAGKGGVVVNPENIEAISVGMSEVVERADELISAGREQVKKFDWDDSAKQVWELLKDF